MLTTIFEEFHSKRLWDKDLKVVETKNSLNIHQHFNTPIQLLPKENEVSIQIHLKMPELIKRTKCQMPTLERGFFIKSFRLIQSFKTLFWKSFWFSVAATMASQLYISKTGIQGTKKFTLPFC